MRNRTVTLLLLALWLVVVGWALALARAGESDGPPPKQAPDVAFVGSSWTSAVLSTDAPIGSCARCGRTVWSSLAVGEKNDRITVVDRTHSEVFAGCYDCLMIVLRGAPKRAARDGE